MLLHPNPWCYYYYICIYITYILDTLTRTKQKTTKSLRKILTSAGIYSQNRSTLGTHERNNKIPIIKQKFIAFFSHFSLCSRSVFLMFSIILLAWVYIICKLGPFLHACTKMFSLVACCIYNFLCCLKLCIFFSLSFSFCVCLFHIGNVGYHDSP